MPDVQVDFTALRWTSVSLATIAEDFEDMHKRRSEDAAIWGTSAVRSAMDHFASNWDRHREDLTQSIRKLGAHAGAVADTFEAVDQALAARDKHQP